MKVYRKVFEDYICGGYNMGRRSEGHVNFVYDDMVAKLECIDDTYRIEKEIDEVKTKLKDLRKELAKRKAFILKSVKASRRNNPEGIFNASMDVLVVAQGFVSDIASLSGIKHESLELIGTKMLKKNQGSSDGVKKRKTKALIPDAMDKEKWRFILESVKRNNEVIEVINQKGKGRIFPLWDKREPNVIRIVSSERGRSKKFELYKPSMSTNPFVNFMHRL